MEQFRQEARGHFTVVQSNYDAVCVSQCAIMDDGVFMGYVGFDGCRENRVWAQAQSASLTLISNVLSTFLLKLRLKEGKRK